jgi:hypothetical protein
MHRVQTNAELEALHAAGAGFVFNDFTSGPAGAQYNVLHSARCRWVWKMVDRDEPHGQPSVRKMSFDTIDEARSWIVPNRGPEGRGWKHCATCRPDRPAASGPQRPAGRPLATSHEAEGEQSAASPAGPAPVSAWPTHLAFAMPSSQPLRLPVRPRLASWNKASDPDQVRLGEYLVAADELLLPRYEQLSGPLALRLDVGLPESVDLLDRRDLDNYLLPLATRLSQGSTSLLACVWGTKQHAASSFVRIEQAAPAPATQPFDCCYTIRTDTPSQSEAFKEQIRDQLGTATPVPPGPVRLQLSFTVGPSRNWLNLWKPTIDALGKILGHSTVTAPWAPLDGRIVDLGLHCNVDPTIGNDILIAIAAKHIAA